MATRLTPMAFTDVETWHLELLDLLILLFSTKRWLDIIIGVRKCSCWSLHSPLLRNSQRHRHLALHLILCTSMLKTNSTSLESCASGLGTVLLRRWAVQVVSQRKCPRSAQSARTCPAKLWRGIHEREKDAKNGRRGDRCREVAAFSWTQSDLRLLCRQVLRLSQAVVPLHVILNMLTDLMISLDPLACMTRVHTAASAW